MRRFALALCVGLAAALSVFTANAAVVSATNGILTVNLENAGSSTGQFEVKTGALHPVPNAFVIFPIGTSFFTLRDVTAQEVWVNSSARSGNIGAFTAHSMTAAPATAVVTAVPGGFSTVYTLPNWTVTEVVVVSGTSLSDTNVRQSITVMNTSAVARTYNMRLMWDWYINSNDASIFRTRNPDTAFTSTFAGFDNPTFQAFEEVDNAATPSFSVFGTVTGGPLVPPPTTPDRFGYVSWSAANGSPYDFAISGAGADSATIHFWGFQNPLTLPAGASATYTQYLSTVASSVGVGPQAGPSVIPTLTEWGIVGLAALLGVAGVISLRRRRMI